MYNTRKAGADFEELVATALSENGFWVHRMMPNKNGQPADIIACKDGRAFLIDAKDCLLNKFRKSRIEPNQHTAMQLWEQCGNSSGWFAMGLRDPDGKTRIYMTSYRRLRQEADYLDENRLRKISILLDEWILFIKLGSLRQYE